MLTFPEPRYWDASRSVITVERGQGVRWNHRGNWGARAPLLYPRSAFQLTMTGNRTGYVRKTDTRFNGSVPLYATIFGSVHLCGRDHISHIRGGREGTNQAPLSRRIPCWCANTFSICVMPRTKPEA